MTSRPMMASRRSRRLLVACLCLIAGQVGCRAHYREFVALPRSMLIEAREVAVAGVRHASSGAIDATASELLAAKSGFEPRASDFGPEDFVLLLSDPATLVIAGKERQVLRERIGRRRVLVGDVTECPVDEVEQWVIEVPLPIPTGISLAIAFLGIPITYAKMPDRPHTAVVLRLVDLETGTIDAEYFAVANLAAGKATLTENAVDTALRVTHLRSDP